MLTLAACVAQSGRHTESESSELWLIDWDYARPQSGQRTSGPETRNPRPTRDVEHL